MFYLLSLNVFTILPWCSMCHFLPLYGWTVFHYVDNIFCLPVFASIDIWVISAFWQLCKMVLWVSVYKFLCGHTFLLPFGNMPSSRISGLCGNSLTIWGTAKLLSRQLYHFIFLPAAYESSSFSSLMLIISHVFDHGQPTGYEIVCHYGFWFFMSLSCLFTFWIASFEV